MSCIRFNLPTSAEMTAARRAAPKLQQSAPPFTESKARRLVKMASDPDWKIRERAALDYHVSAELADLLVADPVEGVRAGLARNKRTPASRLALLVNDPSTSVRAFLALNENILPATRAALKEDELELVRYLATLREEQS